MPLPYYHARERNIEFYRSLYIRYLQKQFIDYCKEVENEPGNIHSIFGKDTTAYELIRRVKKSGSTFFDNYRY